MPLLQIRDLHTYYYEEKEEVVKAVSGLSLNIYEGQIMGLLGESGCGKTATALSIMQLQKPGRIVKGEIIYKGSDLVRKSLSEISKFWGREIALIFQDPSTALNPVFSFGQQIGDVVATHQPNLPRQKRLKLIEELLERVGLNSRLQKAYPHQLSGGMKQRVMIALALAAKPCLLIADEPTTGLDVTVKRQILDLLIKIKEEEKMTILLITHDLRVAAKMCDLIALMYQGKIVEVAEKREFFQQCKHPYSQALLSCLPALLPFKGELGDG